MKISAVIITFNEERNIGRCLESLQGVVDEIIVLDSFSTDKTQEICTQYGARFEQHAFDGHIQQKNRALYLATNDMVLSLDADEALTEELRVSILQAKGRDDIQAWKLKRLTNFCGKWIRHTGWYPDKKIRLWNRNIGRWGGQNPHDRVILNQDVKFETLHGDLLHYSFYTINQHIDQIQKFSSIAAKSEFEKGRKSNVLTQVLIGPWYTFVKKYFLQRGFLDGYFGLVISINTAYSKYLKYIKLRELHQQNKS
jgi:glycosyltransferase involved in cell wall biosynthesis